MSVRTFQFYSKFLSKHLVYKLIAIITRFFVSFIKILALLKISVLKSPCFVCLFDLQLNQFVEFSLERKMLSQE